MTKTRYIIVDDEKSCIDELTFLLEKHLPDFECIGIAKTTEAATVLFNNTKPDIIFCDISIGANSIFDVITQEIASMHNIIFITGHQEYTLKALRLSAIDYLIKPIVPQELIDAIERFDQSKKAVDSFDKRLEALEQNLSVVNKLKKIGIYTKDGYIFKEVHDLAFVEGKSNYCELNFTDNTKYTLAKTLLVQEEILDAFGFFRIHQSFLVNLSMVKVYNNNENTLKLTTGEVLPVSTRRRVLLLEKIKSII